MVDISEHRRAEEELRSQKVTLEKRINELRCLYRVANLVNNVAVPLEDIARGMLEILPQGLRYPEIASARMVVNGREFKGADFREGPWCLAQEISVRGAKGGAIHGFYHENRPKMGDEPFLMEERELVSAVAETVGKVIERLDTKEALKESEERYRIAIESSNDGVAIMEGEIHVFVNRRFLEMFGYDRQEDVLGKPISRHVHPIDRDRVREYILRGQKGEPVPERYEMRCVKKNGSEILVEVSAARTTYRGRPVSLVFVRDITERNRAEENRLRLEAAITQASEGVAVTDRAGTITYANPAFQGITGLDRDAILGRPLWQVIVARDKELYYTMREELGRKGSWTGTVSARRKDGTIYDLDWSVSPIRDDSGNIESYVLVMRDISAELVMTRQLRQAQRMEAIGALAGGIAHDFNNILTPIIGFSNLALDEAPEGSSLRESLTEILRAGHRALDLVKQILTFSRQTEQEPSPIQVSLIVKEVLKLMKASLPASIEIRSDIRSEASVLSDPTQIHQIVMNLCTNAAHAMQNREGVLEVVLNEAGVDSDSTGPDPELASGRYLVLSVGDTGIGMSPEIRERIFEPFFTTKAPGEGTGMGLSVVHGIVKCLGGSIAVQSRPGEGSVFRVNMPVFQPQQEPEPEGDALPKGGAERILLVDDEPAVSGVVSRMLENKGYRVTVQNSGLDALQLFRMLPCNFDLVITDMTIRRMTGVQLAEEIMRIRAGVPVILCTGFSSRIDEKKAAEKGIKGFLAKPVIRGELLATVRRVLDGENK